MNLQDARVAIISALDRMNALYTQPVFDEWVLVSLQPGRGAILAYSGPRADGYKKSFTADVQPLSREMAGQKLAVGDFVFVHTATGSQHDAVMRVGDTGFLFCNNTVKSMDEIRSSPAWLKAQQAFVELSNKLRADPVV
jgi:hypothetical protein